MCYAINFPFFLLLYVLHEFFRKTDSCLKCKIGLCDDPDKFLSRRSCNCFFTIVLNIEGNINILEKGKFEYSTQFFVFYLSKHGIFEKILSEIFRKTSRH